MNARVLMIASFALLAGCRDPSYGDLPALCSTDGACPEGYDCIHGVCAFPGTPVPITVAKVGSLRGIDMRLVPQSQSVLFTWQSYAYSEEGQKFVGARVRSDGSVSTRIDIVGRFVAEDDSLEPYYDVLRVDENRLLVAISAPSLPDDTSVDPRLITYRVDLPPEGSESNPPKIEAAWGQEQRLQTVGYGAVSVPKLLDRGDVIEVGYVQSQSDPMTMSTVAKLTLFSMQRDGTLTSPDPVELPARDKSSVAVGVFDAFAFTGGSWWVLDDERPSVLYLLDDGKFDATKRAEAKLEGLAVPVAVDGSSLVYIEPSVRTGDKLAASPVTGPASLRKVNALDVGGMIQTQDTKLEKPLPTVRDMPRPAWVSRVGKPAILVTTGEDAYGSNIFVYTVDPQTGASALVRSIYRYSNLRLEALRATIVGDKLYVGWLETDAESGSIRAAVVAEP